MQNGFVETLIGAAVVGMIVISSERVGWQSSLLGLPLMYLIYCCYRLYVTADDTRGRP